jgi:hypothetical protein
VEQYSLTDPVFAAAAALVTALGKRAKCVVPYDDSALQLRLLNAILARVRLPDRPRGLGLRTLRGHLPRRILVKRRVLSTYVRVLPDQRRRQLASDNVHMPGKVFCAKVASPCVPTNTQIRPKDRSFHNKQL